MNPKSASIISDKLAGWSPSAESQLVIFWRVMHMYMHRYGSIPLGQMLVEMTTIVLNELGRPPTVTDLCETTGLPKSSISRYISAQMNQRMIEELIDPNDRRRRKLVLTDKGRAERSWQIREIRKVFESVCQWDKALAKNGGVVDPDVELESMKRINEEPPERIGRTRKKRGQSAAA